MGSTHELNEKKIGCTNHNVTLNYVVNLGMGLGLRYIHRLSAQSTHLFLYLNFSSLKLLALTALPKTIYILLVMGLKLYVEWA